MPRKPSNRITFSVYLTEAERTKFDQASQKEGMFLCKWIKKQIAREGYLRCSYGLPKYESRFEMQLEPELKTHLERIAKSYGISMTEYARYRCWEGVNNATND